MDKHSYFSESPLASKYLISSGAYLLDRRTGESNQDSLVSVRMKFCSALRSSEVEIFRIEPRRPPGSLSLQQATKQLAKPSWVSSTSLQLITDRATVSLVLFRSFRLSEYQGAREEAFRSGNRKVSEGWDGLGLFLSYQLSTYCCSGASASQGGQFGLCYNSLEASLSVPRVSVLDSPPGHSAPTRKDTKEPDVGGCNQIK